MYVWYIRAEGDADKLLSRSSIFCNKKKLMGGGFQNPMIGPQLHEFLESKPFQAPATSSLSSLAPRK